MASIIFNNLKPTSQNVQEYTYADIFLDLQEEPIGYSGNFRDVPGRGRDIKIAYDMNAIKNSLINLFNTIPGERLLLPDYGSDLRRYIFDPISDMQAVTIMREVYSSIKRWEPRITVTNIEVNGFKDTNDYDINIYIRVPFSKAPFSFKGVLQRQGFVFV